MKLSTNKPIKQLHKHRITRWDFGNNSKLKNIQPGNLYNVKNTRELGIKIQLKIVNSVVTIEVQISKV